MDTDKPSLAFDRVFILLHAFQHLCGHGVGLRQLMDYYYVLKQSFETEDGRGKKEDGRGKREDGRGKREDGRWKREDGRRKREDGRGKREEGRSKTEEGRGNNANDNLNANDEWREDSVYWIKQLGMKRFAEGLMWVFQKFFGMEERYMLFKPNEKEGKFIMEEVMMTGNMGHSETRNWGSLKSPLSRFFYNLRRDIHLATHYPHEALWQPFFSLWLYAWRLSKGLLKDREE